MNAFREIRPADHPVIIAHRGDSCHAPENTLDAAILGRASGAFAWELDVHLSQDGVPVVIHDESLIRTTNVAERFAGDPRALTGFRVTDFTWHEIRQLDAGSWFVDPAGGHRTAGGFGTLDSLPDADRSRFGAGTVRVPSLIDALRLTRDLDWRVNVELKTFPEADPRLLAAVFSDIDHTGTADRVLISSFDHDDVARAAAHRPDIACGALCETPLHHYSAYVRDLIGADFFHTSAQALGSDSLNYLTAPSADALRSLDRHEGRVPVFVYTVNDARPDGLAAHLRILGIAGLFSDNPRAVGSLWAVPS
ncbi:MAG: glpQ [Planctomycetota bacterium]|nr:glpQ [Planctomycetota bacterium]